MNSVLTVVIIVLVTFGILKAIDWLCAWLDYIFDKNHWL